MYHAFWRHVFFVRGQSFSVKIFDRSRNGCQVTLLDWGRETIFVGLPGMRSFSLRVSPSRALVLSCAHYFQAPATQATSQFGRLGAYASANRRKIIHEFFGGLVIQKILRDSRTSMQWL